MAYDVAPTLQAALDDWAFCAPRLEALYEQANATPQGSRWFEVDPAKLAAPLPRAFQWLDARAYLRRISSGPPQARGAELTAGSASEPMLYQGAADTLLGPRDAIAVDDEAWGATSKAELAVVLGDVPRA